MEGSKWTLRRKIGQMVMCGFDGTQPTEGIRELICDYKLGGIIYFRRNIGSSREVAELSAELQAMAGDGADVPLWIAIDQEGGMVSRIDQDIALMPGNMAIGATREAELAYETALVSARELRAMGINMNLAPCLDVNNNAANPVIGVRSFGESPTLVAELGVAAIRGYQEGGVSACVKHFPGHGDTATDSHYELPLVPHDRKRLDEVELAPFRRAIAEGIDAMMTAHVRFPAYERSDASSTISPSILTGLLRERLGYEGIVITDCLEMKAITETVGIGRGAVLAVKAGADVILVSHLFDRQREALDAIYKAVIDGEISEERLDASVRRIVALKKKRLGGAVASAVEIGSAEHVAVARKASERSVTLVKDDGGVLPLRRELPTFVVWPEVRSNTEVDEVIAQDTTLGTALGRMMADVQECRVGIQPSEREIQGVLQGSEGFAQIVVGTYNASFSPGQQGLVDRLLQRGGAKVIVAALRNPYDLLHFPNVPVYLACYENRPIMMESLAKVLVGEIPAAGRLPVTLSAQYPYGHGL